MKLIAPVKAAETSPPTCALPRIPLGEREDSEGTRFGRSLNSRHEFDTLPESFDTEFVHSFHNVPK